MGTCRVLIAGVLFFFYSIHSWAYTLTTTSEGMPVRWNFGQKMMIAGNPSGTDHFSSDDFFSSVVYGLQQWKAATHGMMDFEYWQGTDNSVYTPTLAQNGLNTIFFSSNSSQRLDPNVIGFTQVWFNDSNGQITETHIMLNDINYQLTHDPEDTSTRHHSDKNDRPKVYIGNILTHELGHAIGLSHSGNINSSMLYVEFSEQDKIGCDDWAGARHLYLPRQNGTGELTGSIQSPLGEGISGVQVTVISQGRGIPIASTLTDQNGNYTFRAIETGNVAIYADHYQGMNSSIPQRHFRQEIQQICDKRSIPTTFYTQPDLHDLKLFHIDNGAQTDAGALRIGCDGIQDSKDSYEKVTAPEMLVDRGESKTYRYLANGPFKISGIGYLLNSPVKVALKVQDASGNPITVHSESPIYKSTSKFSIPDTEVVGSYVGEIQVKVATTTTSEGFPRPGLNPNEIPFFVISFLSNPPNGYASELPINARCSTPESHFASYQSPPGLPPRFASTRTARDTVGFCGNAQADPTRTKNPRSSVPIPAILEWFFPFFVAFAIRFSLQRLNSRD